MTDKNMNPQFTCPTFRPPRLLYDNMGSNYIQEGGKEISLKLDSKDRDIKVYPNPFSFRVVFNPMGKSWDQEGREIKGTPRPYCDRVINNVKTIRLEYLTLPMTTAFTLKSTGLITFGWTEFDREFASIDPALIELKQDSDGHLVIFAHEKSANGTMVRKNQILFKSLEINDRITIQYTLDGQVQPSINVDIEQMQYNDDEYFIVSQQSYPIVSGTLMLTGISKSNFNETRNKKDDYHAKIVNFINNPKHIGSTLSVNDTIKLRDKYYYIKQIVSSSRILLNDRVDRTWTNVPVTIDDEQTIRIDTTYRDLYDSVGNLKLKDGFQITLIFTDGPIAILTINSSHGNQLTVTIDDGELGSKLGSHMITVKMWRMYEELKTFSADNDESLIHQRYICMKIKELHPSVMSTNDGITDSFAVLHTERYGNGNIMVHPNAEIVFENQNLYSINTMTFEFFDENFKQISCDFSEYFLNEGEYIDHTNLLIHPQNKHFQIFMSFKVITIEQTLSKNNFC